MSNDMSMFKKMKERITDEVNSATNKLQNMQIIDQLASSIGQQIKNDMMPDQLLPEPHDSSSSTKMQKNSQFSLIDDGPIGGYNEEEELNSETSPQHQLFNEHTITRLNQPGLVSSSKENNGISLNSSNLPIGTHTSENGSLSKPQAVIDIQELSSDLEDGFDDTLDTDTKEDGFDVEIDLLSNKPIPNNKDLSINDKLYLEFSSNHLALYKTRYKNVVHSIRNMSEEFKVEKSKLEAQRQELLNQITALKTDLDNVKQQQNSSHDSLLSVSTSVSETEKSVVGSPQPPTKSSTKLRDLERLLAKCKESLKKKNSQIQALKESLGEVEKFKNYNQELKRELGELREAHEIWTVSIAENKQIMHQEIESKNAEMEKQKAENNDLQLRLTDSQNKIRQLKSTIQDLESRLVSTSAAHQKERESLTKELTMAKNNAIRQIRTEHEHNIERVKLDLEKSIEVLKVEILNKDEQLMKSAELQQQLYDKNQALTAELEESNKKLHDQLKILDESREHLDQELKRCSGLRSELESLKTISTHQNDLDSTNKELGEQIEILNEKLSSLEATNKELEKRLNDLNTSDKECELCEDLKKQVSQNTERFQQELHELNVRLNLMTTANDDQEKAINSLKMERALLGEKYKSLKSEFDELLKKNDSLSRVIRENETDMQAQQDQLDQLTSVENKLDSIKRENSSLSENMNQLKTELSDRNSDLAYSRNQIKKINNQLAKTKTELEDAQKISGELRTEKDSLISLNESFNKQKRELEEQIVVRILSAMKNLATPNTSPGSDKSYEFQQESTDGDDTNLPDPMNLIEQLSSLALDRSTACMTATQRLQAVLLDNSMMGEELRRLKDELNNFSREKTLETQCSIEETEKLITENQALIHDQQSYDDRIRDLEEEIEMLTNKLAEKSDDKEVETDPRNKEELELVCKARLEEINELKMILAEKEKLQKSRLTDIEVNRSLLETYRQRIEDLNERLNKLESDCQSKDRQIAQITDELRRVKEDNSSIVSSQSQRSTEEINNSETNCLDKTAIERLETEKVSLLDKISNLEEELKSYHPLQSTGDHTYQIKALQRVLQQYQEENQRLKESQKSLTAQIHKDQVAFNVPNSTEFEYLKNIVYQFMLGREPLVLARVISAVFKFDKSQVEQICKTQEAVQSALKHLTQ